MAGRRALAVALLLATLGTACDDEPEPDIADPSPTSSTATPSESETSPTTSPTPEALTPEETVRAWFAAFTTAMQTGALDEVVGISSPECESCNDLMDQVASVYERGGHYETKGWTAPNLAAAPNSTETQPVLVARVVQARRALFDADGVQVDVAKKQELPMRLTLTKAASDAWVVARLEILE